MKLKFLIVAFVLIPFVAFAQTNVPIDTADQTNLKQKSQEYLKNIKWFDKQIKTKFSGSERTNISTHYKKVHKQFNEDLLKGGYVYDQRFTGMVDRLVEHLESKNATIPNSVEFFISKELTLNASSLGDHYFVLNLGTFRYLQNEEQLASILSHEIGHLILSHSLINLKRYYSIVKDQAKNQAKEVKQEKSNRSEKAWNNLRQILYEESRFNRIQEYEADSIGYVLYRNTGFSPVNYLNTLVMMDSYDSIKPMGLENQIYKRVFDLPAQSFRDEWLKQENFKVYDYSNKKVRINEDSIDNHPRIKDRIANIKRIFPELNDVVQPICSTVSFDSLQQLAKACEPFCLDYQEEYGFGLYVCLLNLQDNDKDPFYRYWLGHFFSKIYDARKNYTLNRYLEQVDPKEQSESYQQFLSFMWNLSLNEIKNIKEFYQ